MGANQSSKHTRQQFESNSAATQTATISATQSSHKNSFSKQQLNRLFRKSLPTHSRLNTITTAARNEHRKPDTNCNSTTNECKLNNGNNKSDELVRVSSGQLVGGVSAGSGKSIYGHESGGARTLFVGRDGNEDPTGGIKLNAANGKYFVSDQARHERLANNNWNKSLQTRASAVVGPLSKTTESSCDANREQAVERHPELRRTTSKPQLELDRLLLVRQQQQQRQQFDIVGQHRNKSIMTTPTSTTKPVQHSNQRQPLNSSNTHHYDHQKQPAQFDEQYHHLNNHNQQQHRKQTHHNQEQLIQHKRQQNINSPGFRPNKSKTSDGGASSSNKAPQAQQLKSSCSPSSASASSSSPNSSSGSSATTSSNESLKLQRQLEANNKRTPLQMVKQSVTQHPTQRLDLADEYPVIDQGLVAMQRHHDRHRRAHSSGEPLSWLKQAPISVDSHNISADQQQQQQQQRLLLTNNLQQANEHWQYHDHLANLTLDPHQTILSPSNQHLSQQPIMDYGTGRLDEVEQLYVGNLHLLAGGHQDEAIRHAQQLQQQQLQQAQHQQHQQHLYVSSTLGHMSAPLQRRYKWPKQQYQYLNNSATTAARSGFPQNNQQQYHIQASQLAALRQLNQQLPQPVFSDDHRSFVPLVQASTPIDSPNSSAIYFDQDPASGSYLFPHHQHHSFDAASSTINSSSKSLRKSPASRGKARSRNPLAGIFGPLEKTNTKFGANTIHHLSSSKSHQNLQSSTISRSSSQSNKNANSLKRIKSGPLTAQQTSYEAMRTIDMYLIRQIARSCMDFEMEQRIDLEIRLRELAAQSMLEARNEIDVLEVEKSLLTSDQRMNCYASQLEQQRKRLSNPSLATTDSGRGSKNSYLPSTTGCINSQQSKPNRADVIGREFGSPSYSSISKSSQSSPSKLSPVSGESANAGSNAHQSQPPPQPPSTSLVDGTSVVIDEAAVASTTTKEGHNNRSSLSRANHHVIRRPTSTSNTLSRRHRSQRQRHRERLAQLISSQWGGKDSQAAYCKITADTKATITLSELRVPLMWRDVDHFKGRGDYRRYAVFCLAKIGSQIYDTQLISDVDRQMTDLTFEDVIMFNKVELDFELELEVYSCVYLEQFSLSNTPRKLMEKLSNSVGRAMGRRLATQTASINYIKELEAYDKSYRFAMIANAKLSLVDASDSIKTYDLQLMSPEAHGRHATTAATAHSQQPLTSCANNLSTSGIFQAQNATQTMNRHCQPVGNHHNGIVTAGNQRDLRKNTLPLFGHFCCRLHASPNLTDDGDNNRHTNSGYL